MKLPAVLCALLMSLLNLSAQMPVSASPASSPQVIITIHEHATTADMVEMTVLDPKYPADLLREQANRIASLAGSTARGLQIFKYSLSATNPKLQYLRATFATDNIIDRAAGVIRLEPLVRGLAGAPDPYTIRCFDVNFAGEQANPKTLRSYKSDSIVLVGNVNSEPAPGIEYRINLLSQDDTKLRVPERFEKPAKQKPAPAQTKSAPNMVLTWVFIGGASVAVGALVYFATLRPTRPDSNTRRKS